MKGMPHIIKTRDGGRKGLSYTRAQAIKLFCVACLGWEVHPKECTAPLCPLFPYRGITLASQHGSKA